MLEKLKRNLNLILIVLLMLTMAVASFANQRRAERQSSAVSLPVTRTDSSGGAVETCPPWKRCLNRMRWMCRHGRTRRRSFSSLSPGASSSRRWKKR